MHPAVLRVALLGIGIVRACGSPTEVGLDQEFELAPGAVVRVAGTSQTIAFVGVTEDSRCPAGVTCVWAGNGKVRLRVRSADRDSSVDLNTTLEPHAATVGAIRIELKVLAPSPRAGVPIPSASYRARLLVTGS